MPPWRRLKEDERTRRRTIADALDVVGQIADAEIRLCPLQLPCGRVVALVNVLFPSLGYIVSLPTSSRVTALVGLGRRKEPFPIWRLQGAKVAPDGSVLLVDGTRLRAVEVIPSLLPYTPSETEQRILWHVICLVDAASYCLRSIREGLPEYLRDRIPDIYALDYGRVRTLQVPFMLKQIQGYIQDH